MTPADARRRRRRRRTAGVRRAGMAPVSEHSHGRNESDA